MQQILRGRADAYLHTTLIKKWDVCAGNALLHAGLGHMTTLRGDLIDYSAGGSLVVEGGLLATTGQQKVLHDLFLDRWERVHSKPESSI